jgi:hypothetical protein
MLIETVAGDISCVTADGAYDTVAIYEAADVRGDKVVMVQSGHMGCNVLRGT